MKAKSFLIAILALLFLSLEFPAETLAQGKGKGPPPWAPAHGYRAKTRHIYFPQYNFYFDLQRGVYIYLSGTNWQVGVSLPSAFAGVDLIVATKVELELDSDTPQKYNANHKVKYKVKVKNDTMKMKTSGGEKDKKKNK
jgi:hypothetical protein